MPSGTIEHVLDPDQLVLCEHDLEPEECPICGREEAQRAAFDPLAWLAAYGASPREPLEVPPELAGVPFA